MIETSLEAWITRFAAGAGTLFDWHCTEDGELVAPTGQITGTRGTDPWFCPLTAQATFESGIVFVRHDAKLAAYQQGLTTQHLYLLRDAADDNVGASPEHERSLRALRRRLLRICRLEGAPQCP